MKKFPLHKVVWRDGDVVTENHFNSFESWIENLVGLANQNFRKYGLFRNSILQDSYNLADNINFHVIDVAEYKESQYRIDIEKFQAVNPFGQIIKIDERRSFNLRIQFSKQSEEGFIMAYIMPVTLTENNMEKVEGGHDEIETGMVLYHGPCELTTSNDHRLGVPILRFRLEGGHLDVDNTFIPFGMHLDSSSVSFDAHERFVDMFRRYEKLLSDYLHTLRPTPELAIVWDATSGLYRAVMALKPYLTDPMMFTVDFFRNLQEFINLVVTELKILSIGFDQDYLRQQSADTIEALEKPLINILEHQYDLNLGFQQAYNAVEHLMKYLEFLPEGPISEKQLPIERVELSKVAGSNKLKVHLSNEVEFKKGKTLMTIYLRSYTNAEPIHKNVRVSLGDVSQAMLKDLRNALKPIAGESLSYRIECPAEIINRDKANIITIYVPTPIGEGVPDLKRYLTINIRE